MRKTLLAIIALTITALPTDFRFTTTETVPMVLGVDFEKSKGEPFRFYRRGSGTTFISSADNGLYWCTFDVDVQKEILDITSYIGMRYLVPDFGFISGYELNTCYVNVFRKTRVIYTEPPIDFDETYGSVGQTEDCERMNDLEILLKRLVYLGSGITIEEYFEIIRLNKGQ